jgi:hypothetical protein
MIDGRNKNGLDERQIQNCLNIWEAIKGNDFATLDISKASENSSKTYFDEKQNVVFLGANIYPGTGTDANCRMSPMACLAHELSHVKRAKKGFTRPFILPDCLIDEAETSTDATFEVMLNPKDREDLIEDARDRLTNWLAMEKRTEEEDNI